MRQWQVVGIPMGKYCAPLVAGLFLLNLLLRKTLSYDKQTGVIVTFGLASGVFLNIDNPCFEGVVSQMVILAAIE